MTREQLDLLEEWIVTIIRDCDRASGLQDAIRRRQMKDEVIKFFAQEGDAS